MRLLLIEDQTGLFQTLANVLRSKGFSVDVAARVAEDGSKAQSGDYDAILLALDPSDENGFSCLQRWRRQGLKTHIIVLLPGSSNCADRVRSLDLGADDCLAAPFPPRELVARVRALLRRNEEVPEPTLRVHDLEINTAAHLVRRAGRLIHLTPLEYKTLTYLALRRGKVVTRSMLWAGLYDAGRPTRSNVIDVYVHYLRKKIDEGFSPPLILTCHGQGYRLRPEGDGFPAANGSTPPILKALPKEQRKTA